MPYIQTDHAYFLLQENETLLEALERTGHQVEYQCREGYCGSCRTRLVSGSVQYAEQPLAFVSHDEILPCCCKVTEDVRIEAQYKK